MKKYKVLHVSPTPLVDAPRKVSDTINMYTDYESNYFMFKDYPGKLEGKFSTQALIYDKAKDIILEMIQDADIIHVHNFLSSSEETFLIEHSKCDVRFIYQAHSPLREGPIFTEYAENSLIKFHQKCVIAQYHPRLYPSYTLVPNIILHTPTLKLIKDDEVPKVLFSPAHTRTGGRWNDKVSPELSKVIKAYADLGLIKLTIAEGYSPYELYQLRKFSHISIDEIVTGAYHQISLEGLCSGNVVINNSDVFSDLILKSVIGKENILPFYKANKHNIADKMKNLIENKDLIRSYQQASHDYYIENLHPKQLVVSYINLYDEVLENG